MAIPSIPSPPSGSSASAPPIPPPAIIVRLAQPTPHDVESIVSIGRDVFGTTFAHQTTPENMAAYLDKVYSPVAVRVNLLYPGYTMFVAEVHSPSSATDHGQLRGPHPSENATSSSSTPASPPLASPPLAGFISMGNDPHPEPSIQAWPNPIKLRRIHVAVEYHGVGAARVLVDHAMDWARKEGYESIWLGVYPDNARAVRFYQKLGFEKVGSHEFMFGEKLEMDDVMIRRL